MREIKFRAWDKKNKKMIFDCIEYRGMLFWDSANGHSSQVYSIDIKIMQFTGLKDKNGKEIYEGDIIKRYPLIPLYTVEWINQSAGWFLVHKDMRMPMSEMYLSIIEIIGNIHEHPELLK